MSARLRAKDGTIAMLRLQNTVLTERLDQAEAEVAEGLRLVHALDEAWGFRDLEIPAMEALVEWAAPTKASAAPRSEAEVDG